jgi:RNA polymerase sigma factor (sigma-70 family)
MRKCAADMVHEQRDSIMRRIHLLLGDDARKITDTEDILSTAMRRIDRVIERGRLRAMNDVQFYAFVHAVIRRTILEKARNSRRIKAHEQGGYLIQSAQEVGTEYSRCSDSETIERVGQLITDPIDREIVLLRGRDHSFVEIAQVVQMSPQAVRKRWSRIRATVRELIAEGRTQ